MRAFVLVALLAGALAALPSLGRGDPPPVTLDRIRYKVKPVDGALWAADYGHGEPVGGLSTERPCIAFTFDDGPDWRLTPRLLDILDAHDVRATFFVLGRQIDWGRPDAARNRAVLRDEVRRGHLVGNHSYHHRVLDRMSVPELTFEIDRTAALIHEVLGQRPTLFRAPYGAIDSPRARGAVLGRGYTLVRWALDPRDWDATSAHEIAHRFAARLDEHPLGGILLLHDVHPHTIAAVPLILDEIARRNDEARRAGRWPYEIVGLEEFYRPAHSR